MTDLLSLGGLFLSAVGSATILPGTSEAVLAGLLYQGLIPVTLLWLVASVGNTAGCILNWWAGTALEHLKDKKWKKLVTPNKSLTNEMLTSKYNSISIEKMGALYDETDTSMFLSIDTFHKKMKKNHPRALYKMLVELTK